MLQFSNEASHSRYVAMAEKIAANPALLEIPLENIGRWISQGSSAPTRLEHWRTLILDARESAEGMAALLNLMRDDSEPARRLKSFGPFAGILTREERDRLRCAYSH